MRGAREAAQNPHNRVRTGELKMLNFKITSYPDLEHFYGALVMRGARIGEILRVKMDLIGAQLAGKVKAKMVGFGIQRRTGALENSVVVIPTRFQGKVLRGAVLAGGASAPYARYLETGGSRAYEIVATKARALHFQIRGKDIFANSVLRRPLPSRPFMRSVENESVAWFREEMIKAISEAIEESKT
jgi:hypothetical protein